VARALPVAPAAAVQPAERTLLIDQNKKLSVGDLVSVEIMQDREAPVARQVTPTGEIDVASLVRVKVAGKTTAEAAAEIKRRLEADYYYEATVRLSIDRVNTQATMGRIQMNGEVRAPGVIETFDGENLRLSEAILRSGNFKEFANPSKVQVTRTKGGRTEKFIVDVKKIMRTGDESNDIILQDGDRVFIPKTFFRLGD
jgi:polysaccharide export outer membrane protein